MLSKFNTDKYFVHFTQINKVGINPRPFHRDPIGIYLFPVKWVL